jgi:anaphase-promoting complex subunit 6
VLELLNRQESNDVKLIQAESAFNCQNFSLAYEIIKKISDEDPYFVEIVPLHCSVLIELEKQGELYFLAHKLVNANPDSAISWYAVGSYYYLIKKYP